MNEFRADLVELFQRFTNEGFPCSNLGDLNRAVADNDIPEVLEVSYYDLISVKYLLKKFQ